MNEKRVLQILAAGMALAVLALLTGCEVRRPPRVVRMARPTISIHDAVRRDHREELALNRAVGVDVNLRDLQGATPLHVAAELGREAAADLLIAWGADVNAQDAHGRTPMHLAASAGQAGIERLLIAASANVNANDAEGLTPVLTAHLQNRKEVFDLLISAGAEFDFAPEVEEWVPAPAAAAGPAAPAPSPAARRTGGSFRIWTSASSAQIEAEFVDIVTDTVVLRSPQNELFRIPITRLTREDQILARQMSGAAPPRLVRRTSPAPDRPGRTSADSLGPRIGKQNGWTLLENCRLEHNDSNDGDSLHISHQGKEYIFRLYYVDAPETSLNFPQRVEDQGRYFNLKAEEALNIGHKAARFTTQALAGKPLTIATKWEDARGQSALPRYYAFITTDAGDLDEMLVAEGLARIYGMPISSSLGDQKRQNLKRLESKARQGRHGAWNKSKSGEETEAI
ncbi:MAG: ankyrin repeat domain-containing protein [Kiritimatiellae bacterium]|nr:ankyrin repeat domain-containing protein [Kiritimatiellia bacterium]